MNRLLLISSSNVHGYGYLDHPEEEIRRIAAGRRVTFVPFAGFDHADYFGKIRERLELMGLEANQFENVSDLENAEVLFVGGGSTPRLLKKLYECEALGPIRAAVAAGLPYIGSSAGTVITAPTIRTTNDMPIVEPPSLTSLGLVPYQINPHYQDPDPTSTHMGETREQRLLEFHQENSAPVVGLREGSMLRVEDGVTTLVGCKPARIFRRDLEPVEVDPGTVLDEWLK